MNPTKIEYLDYTTNPITGCSGDGCAVRQKCWAFAMAKRLRGRYGYPKENPFQPTFHEDRLNEPFQVKKPSRIGLCFMGDFFDKNVKREWQARVHVMVSSAYWHIFIILTKQPQNIPLVYFPENLCLGVSVNYRKDLWRIDELLRHMAKVHIISFEPLYEDMGKIDFYHIEWVIIGAQTRPLRRPKKEWVNNLVKQADKHKIPVFLKDNLGLPYPRQEFPK